MIKLEFDKLETGMQALFFEAAANPALQTLLENTRKNLTAQLLALEEKSGESEIDFTRRFNKIKINLSVIQELQEISAKVISEAQAQIEAQS